MNLVISEKVISTILFGLSLIASLIFALGMVASDSQSIRGVEQNIISSVNLLLNNAPLYTDPLKLPFSATQYSPLQYQVIWLIAILFDVDPGSAIELTLIARSLSFVFLVATSIMIYKIAREYSLSPLPAFVCALSVPVFTLPWSVLTRPDIGAALFGMVGLYILLRSKHVISWPTLLFLSFSLSLSFLFKQSGIIFIFSCITYLVINRYYRESIVIVVSLLSILIIYYLSLKNVLGADSKFLIFTNLDNGYDFKISFLSKFIQVNLLEKSWLIVFWVYSIYLNRKKILTDPVAIYSLLIFVYALSTSIKNGSAEHYLNEWSILAIVHVTGQFTRKFSSSTFCNLFLSYMLLYVTGNAIKYKNHFVSVDMSINQSIVKKLRGIDEKYDFVYVNDKGISTFFPRAIRLHSDVLSSLMHQGRYDDNVAFKSIPYNSKILVMSKKLDGGHVKTLHDVKFFKKTDVLQVCSTINTGASRKCLQYAIYERR